MALWCGEWLLGTEWDRMQEREWRWSRGERERVALERSRDANTNGGIEREGLDGIYSLYLSLGRRSSRFARAR